MSICIILATTGDFFSSSIRVTYARLSAGGLGYDGNPDPNIPES